MRRIILIAVLVIVVLLLIAQFGPAVVHGETMLSQTLALRL
jgi:hypothetical protein